MTIRHDGADDFCAPTGVPVTRTLAAAAVPVTLLCLATAVTLPMTVLAVTVTFFAFPVYAAVRAHQIVDDWRGL